MSSLALHRGAVRTLDDTALRQRVHRRLIVEGGDETDALAPAVLRARLTELLREEQPMLAATQLESLLQQLLHEVAGLGPLEPLLADPTVTEVMLNGPNRAYVERHGNLEPVALGLDADAIVRLVGAWWRHSVCASTALRRWSMRASPMAHVSMQ